jgi:tRNA splicing ligase
LQWEALKEHTAAPYVLSLKSNGCIIFIAAITPEKIIVTSKHSVGTGDESVSHALVGRKWLNKYLAENDKTEADLAEVLWKNRWTAIAEVSMAMYLASNFILSVLALPFLPQLPPFSPPFSHCPLLIPTPTFRPH